MFIDSLCLITMIASNCPEVITEVDDDYIIVDTTVIYKLSATMMCKTSEIELLPPIENKADSFSVYPYVNLIEDPSVHIVRAHIKQDFKSSEILSFNYFRKDSRFLQEGSNGESSPFVCI